MSEGILSILANTVSRGFDTPTFRQGRRSFSRPGILRGLSAKTRRWEAAIFKLMFDTFGVARRGSCWRAGFHLYITLL